MRQVLNQSELEIINVIKSHLQDNICKIDDDEQCKIIHNAYLDIDYWSIITTFILLRNNSKYTIYCKFPKNEWFIKQIDKIENNVLNKKIATDEYDGLVYLSNIFESKHEKINVIKPIAFIEQYRAILTEGIEESREIYLLLKEDDQNNYLSINSMSSIKNCAEWLSVFHKQDVNTYNTSDNRSYTSQIEDIKHNILKLDKCVNDKSILQMIIRILNNNYTNKISNLSLNAMGIEIRNFIYKDDAIYFLDTGEIKQGSIYEDIARIIASINIIYWGELKFLYKIPNLKLMSSIFLEEYSLKSNTPINDRMLNQYLIKQYLKLWYEGLLVLSIKKIPNIFKIILQKIYIDNYFNKEINQLLLNEDKYYE